MKKLLCLAAILTIVGVSCVKKEYDLSKDNLDLTIKVGGNEIHIPIAQTDTLWLGDFLDMDIYKGGYAIMIDSSLSIEVPEINDFNIDPITIDIRRTIDFSDFTGFPTVTFPNVNRLDTSINSGFWLPPVVVGTIPSGTSIAAIVAIAATAGYPELANATSASLDTVFAISISETLDNKYIAEVDTVWLQQPSGFSITATALGIPNGIVITLDRVFLKFPEQVNLDMNTPGVTNKNIFEITGKPISALDNLTIPVLYLTNLYDGTNLYLDGEIEVVIEYSLDGTYTGGNFPTTPEGATSLKLAVEPSLIFESATITLNTALMDTLGLPRTVEYFDINEVIPNDIIINRVDSVTFNNTGITLNLTMNETGGKIVDNLLIDMIIEFPKRFVFAPHPNINSQNIFEQEIEFIGGKAQLNFPIRRLNLSTLSIIDNTIDYQDSIVVKAGVSLKNPKINTKQLESIKLDFAAVGELGVNFGRVYANITYDIQLDGDETIDLSDLPDIIMNNRDSLILDVNPYLDLQLTTNLQIPFGAEVFLVSYRGGVPINELDITVSVNETSGNLKTHKFWISKADLLPPTGEGYTHIERDLASAIRKVPDSIAIRMGGGINGNAIFDFNIEGGYKADLDYKFVVPLSFGPQFRVLIQDTIFDLDSIVGKMISGNKIGLSAHVLNNIPLDLIVRTIPINENNQQIPGITVTPFEIKANTQMSDNPATLEIDDPNDRLKEMRGMILQFEAKTGTNSANVPLSPNNFIKAKISASIKGGVTIDLNDFLNND